MDRAHRYKELEKVKVGKLVVGKDECDKSEEETAWFALVDMAKPILKPFAPRKWIWIPQHKIRLWYMERAEHWHPLFEEKKSMSIVDIAAEQGELGVLAAVLDKALGKLNDLRPGGYQCGLCGNKVASTKVAARLELTRPAASTPRACQPIRVGSTLAAADPNLRHHG